MRNRWLLIIVFGLLLLSAGYFSLRKIILNKVLNHFNAKMEASIGLHLSFQQAGFSGFKTIYLQHLTITHGRDTIVRADSIIINPQILSLLTGKKKLKELSFYHTEIRFNNEFISLMLSKIHHPQKDSLPITQVSFAGMLNSWKNTFFKLLPANSIIRNSGFYYEHDSVFTAAFFDNFSYGDNEFAGDITVADNKIRSKCFVKGILNPRREKVDILICHADTARFLLPCLGIRWQTYLGFDTARFSLEFAESSADIQQLRGNAAVYNFAIQDIRVGPEIVSAKSSSIQFVLNIGQRYAEIDSSSTIRFNRFSFSPYFRYDKNKDRIIQCAFIKKEFEATDLFESLPEGLFNNFKGIKTSGKLEYHMKALLNLDHPDSIVFESNLENKGFKITKYGVTDFRLINGPFNHDVYEHDQFIKSILVGPENPDFVPIQAISPYLKYAILTSEDGDFYFHHGFNERAFRESIVTNLKEHRFARGGSTLTMQLVKNAFLNRNKTISRKLEEALTVWMIENLHLVNKDRMFEVYLNIIEWGPYVYGIKPAAKFYFNKTPGALSLSESIYLTSIIPRPKAFKYTFVSNGQMTGFYSGYSKLLTSIMIRRNQITPYDSSTLKPFVKLTGDAKRYLTKPDSSSREDSLFYITPNQLLLDNNLLN